jgi:hypothetical protein
MIFIKFLLEIILSVRIAKVFNHIVVQLNIYIHKYVNTYNSKARYLLSLELSKHDPG